MQQVQRHEGSSVPARPAPRSARSREGCVTCKRRKVKCDEQRPRCAHCERLNMECKWQQGTGHVWNNGNTAHKSQRPGQTHHTRSNHQPPERQGPAAGAGSNDMPDIVLDRPLPTSPPNVSSVGADAIFPSSLNAVNEIFDFASFMWDSGDVWQEVAPDAGVGVVAVAAVNGDGTASSLALNTQMPTPAVPGSSFHLGQQNSQSQPNGQPVGPQEMSEPSTVPDTGSLADMGPLVQVPAENHRLMDYFTHAVIPPILAEVETQKKWIVMRRVLVGRANASRMVRWAILAFSNLILTQREGAWLASQQNHYNNALAEVVAVLASADTPSAEHEQNSISSGSVVTRSHNSLFTHNRAHSNTAADTTVGSTAPRANGVSAQAAISLTKPSKQRENLLATLFFLSYVDILEGHIEAAHSNLKRAHGILQNSAQGNFSAIERQFLLWLRLLDARAVSAGGEGLFLSKDDEALLVETPPAGALEQDADQDAGSGTDKAGGRGGHGTGSSHDDIEDALFQILYQPGVIFFQKVQSFMGRISRIDPWHRSRGTVEDEIEVMNIGAAIAADLRALYDSRPPLMDYAVTGRLTAAHVSAHLAFAITRSFRTYLSNYYASKVHLHRVAYKTLPLTHEAADALAQIRRLARLLVEGLDAEEALPVNMLWPLLMLGSEEQDGDQRAWIKTQILRMEKVAGNSRITAQVLDEVQVRQDATKQRVDIRSVMHDIFNSCFAIV